MRIVGKEGTNGGGAKHGPVLTETYERSPAGSGYVVRVSGPTPHVLGHLRERVKDPFRQLVMAGFNSDESTRVQCTMVPEAEITYLQNGVDPEVDVRFKRGADIFTPGFSYLSLAGAMREVNLVAGGSGLESPMLDLFAHQLSEAVFDRLGCVRGSQGLMNALPLLAPKGSWWIHAWSTEETRLRGLLPGHCGDPVGSRFLVVGREVIVNAALDGRHARMATSRDLLEGLSGKRSGESLPVAWRSVNICKFQEGIQDLRVEIALEELPVLAIGFDGHAPVQRYSFERFTDSRRIDPVINDGPTPHGATIVRLPEMIHGDLLERCLPRVRRSVTPSRERHAYA